MGHNKKAKKSKANVEKIANKGVVEFEKRTKKSEIKSNMSRRPKWRFKKRDCEHGRWHIEITEELLEKLADFETMTWSQILIKDKKKNHSIKTYELIKEAQKRLIKLNLDDYDEVYSLRLSGKHRLFGILDEDGVFSVIWSDLVHEICPSQKKHT